jgi:pimeloyl-ACP methyl ester carboxylesterase
MAEPRLWEDDPISVPLLVVLAESRAWNEDFEAWVKGTAADSEYRVRPDVSHFLMLEDPEWFNAELAAFVGRVDGSGA